jgi:hypothetical protein
MFDPDDNNEAKDEANNPLTSDDEADVEMSRPDSTTLQMMDAHVRAILADASPHISALNTALGHDPSFCPGPTPVLPPLTDELTAAAIAEMYAYYHDDTSDDDAVPVSWREEVSGPHSPSKPDLAAIFADVNQRLAMQEVLKWKRLLNRRPPRTQPYVTTSTPHSGLELRFEAIPQAMEGSQATPYEPPDTPATMIGSSSSEPPRPTLRPRASWMLDDGDDQTNAQADADWNNANDLLRARPGSHLSQPNPPNRPRAPPTPPPPLQHIGLPFVKDKKERDLKRVLLPLDR